MSIDRGGLNTDGQSSFVSAIPSPSRSVADVPFGYVSRYGMHVGSSVGVCPRQKKSG